MKTYQERMLEQDVAVFDVDMTLVDTFWKCHRGTNTFLKQQKLGEINEDWTRRYVMPAAVPDILIEMEKQWPMARFGPQARQEYGNALAEAGEHTIVYEGVKETMNWLRDNKIQIAIATGSVKVELKPSLDALARTVGREFWSSVVDADDVFPDTKPHPRSIELTMQNLGGKITKYAMFGDSYRDMELARNASPQGMKVFINTGNLAITSGLCEYHFQSMAEQYEALTCKRSK